MDLRGVGHLLASSPVGVLWPVLVAVIVLFVVLGRQGRAEMAHFAIMASFKAARDLASVGLAGVSDADLKKLADSAYTALPSAVLVGGIPVPVGLLKLALSETAWEQLVQRQYHRFADYYRKTVAGQESPRPVQTPLPVQIAAVARTARALSVPAGVAPAQPAPADQGGV